MVFVTALKIYGAVCIVSGHATTAKQKQKVVNTQCTYNTVSHWTSQLHPGCHIWTQRFQNDKYSRFIIYILPVVNLNTYIALVAAAITCLQLPEKLIFNLLSLIPSNASIVFLALILFLCANSAEMALRIPRRY